MKKLPWKLLVLLMLVCALALPRVARAEPAMRPEVQKIYDEATTLFNGAQYQTAIERFKAAFAMQQHSKILYSWAQATRLLGDCGEAVALYRRYLATLPPEGGANAAKAHIATCQSIMGSGPTPSPSPSPSPVYVPPSPSPSPSVEPSPSPSAEPSPSPVASGRRTIAARHWYQDVLGDILVGAGGIGIGVGVVYFLKSSTSEDDAGKAATYGDYEDKIDQAKSERTIAITSLAVGGALAAYGIVRWVTYGRPEREVDDSGTQVGWFGAPGAGGLVVHGKF